jgi:hypothetical protein
MRFSALRWIILALSCCLLIANFAGHRSAPITGDGHEYVLMSHGILSHGSSNATLKDIDDLRADFRASGTGLDLPLAEPLRSALVEKVQECASYFRTDQGEYYSYHFWFYSLLNVPALALTKVFGLAPSTSFVMTNSAIALATIAVILFLNGLPLLKRYALLAVFALGGTTYYLNWTHPEVFTFSFLLIGLLLFERRMFMLSALLLALAAQHNPPIGVIAAIALAAAAYFRIYLPWRQSAAVAANVLKVAAISFVLILSPLYFMLLFGTPNMIKRQGMADTSLISADRLFSLYFDLDQGMVRGLPWVLALLGGLLMVDAVRRRWFDRKTWWITGALIAASIILAIPGLSTANWNSGVVVFMRYAYWIAVPIGLALANLIGVLPRRAGMVALAVLIIGQAIMVSTNRFYGNSETNAIHSRLSILATRYAPHLYNPIPEIFAERAQGFEGPDTQKLYAYIRRGRLTKVLMHGDAAQVDLPICDLAIDPATMSGKIVGVELGWRYLNVDMPCAANDGFHVLSRQ